MDMSGFLFQLRGESMGMNVFFVPQSFQDFFNVAYFAKDHSRRARLLEHYLLAYALVTEAEWNCRNLTRATSTTCAHA